MAETKAIQQAPLPSNTRSQHVGAGAGIPGLVGCAILFAVAGVFFITENYFVSLWIISIALLVYVTGTGVKTIFLSTFTVLFSSRHLNNRATYIQETLRSLQRTLHLTRDSKGDLQAGPLPQGTTIRLPANPLVKDIQELLREGKGFDYIEYVAHSYYARCHELYDFTSSNFDFVAASMPIFGLIGTILGLMSMFDNLGGDINVASLSPQLAMALKTTLYGALFSVVYKIMGSRFERRIRSLDYDYEAFCRSLQVLIESKIKIEMAG